MIKPGILGCLLSDSNETLGRRCLAGRWRAARPKYGRVDDGGCTAVDGYMWLPVSVNCQFAMENGPFTRYL